MELSIGNEKRSLPLCAYVVGFGESGHTHIYIYIYVTRFAKIRHNDAFLAIQIFASMNSMNLKLCSVVIPMLYCKYFSSYKAR